MKKPKKGQYRLVLKLSLLVLIIIVAAEALSFTSAIVIGVVTGESSSTTQVLASVASSIILGTLLSFIAGNIVLKPLWELIEATKRVSGGDFSVKLEMGWSERHTVRELSQLISAFNNMTGELRSTELFRKDFISSFSHEFKTPLASIRGFARQLYEGDLTPEQQREFSRIILDETEYLSQLSADTLLLTSLENRDIVSEKAEFSLDEQLRECMLHLEPQWSEKDIEIDMEGLEEIRFFWNEQLLAHIWTNLFDNAVKFTPEGGTIRVSCRAENGGVTVFVEDSGAGIPESALPHIFDKFYQADSSHATKGSGLGLPLAKKIAELCGGMIKAGGSDLGGARFTVTLPQRKAL